MNNAFSMMVRAYRSGGNPLDMARGMLAGDPRFQQAEQMIRGKSPEQIRQMVENMCKERGTTPEQIAQQIGL